MARTRKYMVLFCCFALWITQLQAQDANEELLKKIDQVLDEEIDELIELARGEAGEPGGENADLNRSIELHGDHWGGLEAASKKNPLVSEECEKETMRKVIHDMATHDNMEPRQAVEKVEGHLQKRAKALENITYAEYVAHLAECKKLCGKTVKALMGCHIAAVVNLEHDFVFFDLDSTYVKDRYRRGSIDRMASALDNDPDKNILLIGRASRIGHKGYNRTLSRRRARSVEDTLHEHGVDADRVKLLAFGYDPPQIKEHIADAYGIDGLYEQLGDYGINQSVLMVVY